MGKREDWENLLKEHKASGQSAARFCREHGISDSAFGYWRKKAVARRASGTDKFVRVDGGELVAVELPGGKTIRVRRNDLGTVMEALCGR